MEDTERYLNGYDVINWFQLGFIEIEATKRRLNSINVFPVADGDTGTNLATTLKAMAERPKGIESFGGMFWDISEIGLAHARGNSGIIFASYVNGLATESRLFERVNLKEFAHIAKDAVAYIYRAIENPIEGTMVSVIRDWANYIFENYHRFDSFQELFHHAFTVALKSLEGTTEKIAILKRNNVVDSGALGFVGFLKGINDFFVHRDSGQLEMQIRLKPLLDESPEFVIKEEINQEDLKNRYCTEFIVEAYVDREWALSALRPMGDSLIMVGQENQTKIHLHTNTPQEAIWRFQKYGLIRDQKVDDMVFQKEWRKKKYPIGIITDSIADLPEDFILENLITVIPFSVIIDGSAYLDKQSIKIPQLLTYLGSMNEKEGDYPTSSLPEPSRVKRIFENGLEAYESLIVISVSAKLSGAYKSMVGIKEKLQETFPRKKISIIDSRLNAGAQGLLVQKTVELVKQGLPHEDIVKEIEALRKKIKIYVCLENIDNAVRSGRVSGKIGKIAKMFGARPIMTLNSEGEGSTFGIGFSKEGITKRILKLVGKVNREEGIASYNIIHCDNEGLAEDYRIRLTKVLGKEPDYVTEISTITSLYSGKGCVAVSFITN